MGDVGAKGATMGYEQAAMPTRLKKKLKKKNHDGGSWVCWVNVGGEEEEEEEEPLVLTWRATCWSGPTVREQMSASHINNVWTTASYLCPLLRN